MATQQGRETITVTSDCPSDVYPATQGRKQSMLTLAAPDTCVFVAYLAPISSRHSLTQRFLSNILQSRSGAAMVCITDFCALVLKCFQSLDVPWILQFFIVSLRALPCLSVSPCA